MRARTWAVHRTRLVTFPLIISGSSTRPHNLQASLPTMAMVVRRQSSSFVSIRRRRRVARVVTRVSMIRQTTPSAIPVSLLALATTASLTTIPKMRACDVAEHVAHSTCRLFGFVDHCRPRAECRALAIFPYNARSTIHMSVQWITEVRQCRPFRVIVAFIIRILPPDPIVQSSHLGLLRFVIPLPFFFLCFTPQSLRYAFVPSDHMLVRRRRKTIPRQHLRKDLTRVRILDVPLLHCLGQEACMLVRAEQ